MIKNQIDQILLQRSGVQLGGSRSYTRSEVDSIMTNSLQQVLSLYMQSENERHQLAKQLQQLQMGGVSTSNNQLAKNKLSTSVTSPFIVNTKVSIGSVQAYIDSLTYTANAGGMMLTLPNMFRLVVLGDLKNVPTDGDKTSVGFKGKDNGSNTNIPLMIKYNNADKATLDNLIEIFDSADSKGSNISTKYVNGDTGIEFSVTQTKDDGVWEPTTDVLKLLGSKIDFDVTDPNKEFDLSSNDKFIDQLNGKYKIGASHDIETNKANNDVKLAIQIIRGHLLEKIEDGTIAKDLP
jgi:hypothetical protein